MLAYGTFNLPRLNRPGHVLRYRSRSAPFNCMKILVDQKVHSDVAQNLRGAPWSRPVPGSVKIGSSWTKTEPAWCSDPNSRPLKRVGCRDLKARIWEWPQGLRGKVPRAVLAAPLWPKGFLNLLRSVFGLKLDPALQSSHRLARDGAGAGRLQTRLLQDVSNVGYERSRNRVQRFAAMMSAMDHPQCVVKRMITLFRSRTVLWTTNKKHN